MRLRFVMTTLPRLLAQPVPVPPLRPPLPLPLPPGRG